MNNRPSVEQILKVLLLSIASHSDDLRHIERSYILRLEGVSVGNIDRPLYRPVRDILLSQDNKLIKATNESKVKPIMELPEQSFA